MKCNYAVLFKVHFWDDFVERQLRRLEASGMRGAIFVVADETSGPVSVPSNIPTFRYTSSQTSDFGLCSATTNASIIWYNVDYPHYLFFSEQQSFDYYVVVEYDVVLRVSLDRLIEKLHRDQIDYLGSPIRKPEAWAWRDQHNRVYGTDFLTYLSCFAIFSNNALRFLLQRRISMSREFEEKSLSFWPNNEAFIPTELARANYRIAAVEDYGSAPFYDWWPPTHEEELDGVPGDFIHPVLEGERYLKSTLRHERKLLTYFSRKSMLRMRLNRYESKLRNKVFRKELRRRIFGQIVRRLQAVGLIRPWDIGASIPKR